MSFPVIDEQTDDVQVDASEGTYAALLAGKSSKRTSDRELIIYTKQKDIISTTMPTLRVVTWCTLDGRRKMRALNCDQVDSVQVEYMPELQS